MSILSNAYKNLSNLPGWRTKRKIVVFESDDWGSVRMPSQETYEFLLKNGLNLAGGDAKRYNTNDTLESAKDLEALFEVLNAYRDKNGSPCIFTPLWIVANPDFEKIREAGFEQYFYEPFTETQLRYYKNDKAFQLCKEGIEKKIFVPQFHGREHLNVSEWLRALRNKDQETHLAFDHGCWGFKRKSVGHVALPSYQAAFDFIDPNDLKVHKEVIAEGLEIFEQIFGYRATYFVPPNGPFNNSLEEIASDKGIKYMFSPKIQTEPIGQGKTRKAFHYLGQKNKHSQIYLMRNCFFEPNLIGKNWVNECIKEIGISFQWGKPAVISTHRVNYIGGLSQENRKHSLEQLGSLIGTMLKTWPEIEFMTSEKLGELLKSSKKLDN